MFGSRPRGRRVEILADLRFKLAFELFIGFKLHTIHTTKIVPVIFAILLNESRE
jgi:hypothetical protein